MDDGEQVARLLFCPMTVCADGQIAPAAFPVEELLAQKSKTGVSVDRCGLLRDPKEALRLKGEEMDNPAARRNPWGYCIGEARRIRSIELAGNGRQQAFRICPDKVVDRNNPKPWHPAHALILRFNDAVTRAQLRGVRDKLIQAFSCTVRTFTIDSSRHIQTLIRCCVPHGTVITYGDISREVYGRPDEGLAVASAIKKVARVDPETFPWWRVVNQKWMPTQTPPGARERLAAEGVEFTTDGLVAPGNRHQLQSSRPVGVGPHRKISS